jgi:hypothetical protein
MVLSCSNGAALIGLVAIGALNQYLTVCPQTTFWRLRIKRHSHFQTEPVRVALTGCGGLGSKATATLPRTGDLIRKLYICLDRPAITAQVLPSDCIDPCVASACCRQRFPSFNLCDPCGDGALGGCNATDCSTTPSAACPTDTIDPITGQFISSTSGSSDALITGCGSVNPGGVTNFGCTSIDMCTGVSTPWASYVNEFMHAAVKEISICIGGQQIETMWSQFFHLWEEVAGKAGKRLDRMIGKYGTLAEVIEQSRFNQHLMMPVPFTWFRHTGNALPLISLQFHGVTVNVEFEKLENLIMVSDCDVRVINCNTGREIQACDFCFELCVDYVYLDCVERDLFATACFYQIITQVQRFVGRTNSCQQTFTLNFNHALTGLYILVQRKCQQLANNHFNFSGKCGRSPLEEITIKLNNQVRICEHASYFHNVVNWEGHSLIPNSFVFTWLTSLDPESAFLSGSLNLSRIEVFTVDLKFQDGIFDSNTNNNACDAATVYFFARTLNVLSFDRGLGGIKYVS